MRVDPVQLTSVGTKSTFLKHTHIHTKTNPWGGNPKWNIVQGVFFGQGFTVALVLVLVLEVGWFQRSEDAEEDRISPPLLPVCAHSTPDPRPSAESNARGQICHFYLINSNKPIAAQGCLQMQVLGNSKVENSGRLCGRFGNLGCTTREHIQMRTFLTPSLFKDFPKPWLGEDQQCSRDRPYAVRHVFGLRRP